MPLHGQVPVLVLETALTADGSTDLDGFAAVTDEQKPAPDDGVRFRRVASKPGSQEFAAIGRSRVAFEDGP